jgi:hypothetical protein
MDTQAPASEGPQVVHAAASVPEKIEGETPQSAYAAKEAAKAKLLAEAGKNRQKARAAELDAKDGEAETETPTTQAAPKKPANRGKFTKQIESLTAEVAKLRGESKGEFLKALRADPGLLFREINDDPELLVKLAEARSTAADPVALAKLEGERQLAAIRKEREDAESATKQAQAKQAEAQAVAGVSSMIRTGIRRDDGSVIAEARWPVTAAMEQDGEDVVWSDGKTKQAVSIPNAILLGFKALRDGLGRTVNEEETATLLEIVLDKMEAKQAAKAKYHGGAKTPAPAAKSNAPKTITSRAAPGRPAATTSGKANPASKQEKKIAILEQYRNQRLRERANESA